MLCSYLLVKQAFGLVPHTGASYMHSPIQVYSKCKFCNGRDGMRLVFLDGFVPGSCTSMGIVEHAHTACLV